MPDCHTIGREDTKMRLVWTCLVLCSCEQIPSPVADEPVEPSTDTEALDTELTDDTLPLAGGMSEATFVAATTVATHASAPPMT